jgi:hypothetical protein
MSDETRKPVIDDGDYKEFERKMTLFEYGPTTTQFEQLTAAGVQLPEPDSISDGDIRTRLWEVIAGLAKLRSFLSRTNHLSDRELYGKLWHHVLRVETAAIDEIGFTTHIDLAAIDSDEDAVLYLKHYADEEDRALWSDDFPGDRMPAHEDPPFNRDDLLPGPHETVAEAAAWLRANWSGSAFATNRFHTTQRALEFVNQLYDAGATQVAIDDEMMLPNHNWTPYADTLLVRLSDDPAKRSALFDLIEHVGQPDEVGNGHDPLIDCGQKELRLWWD